MLILSPSKGQNFDTPPATQSYTVPVFCKRSDVLVKILRDYSPDALRDLMHISDKLASLNSKRFKAFTLPFTPENAKQAIYAFTGDVYRGLEGEAYTKEQLDFAQDHLRILSGLYGVLRPLDLIQPYRLEMKTKIPNPKGDTLYQFWGEAITEELNRQGRITGSKVLLNLASNEYSKVVVRKKLTVPIIDIHFKEFKNGKHRTIAVHAKRARGFMADYIIKNRINDPSAIMDFNRSGYAYNRELSSEHQMVFTRPQP